MPVALHPSTRILNLMLAIAKAAEVHELVGLPTEFTIRHERNRRVTAGDMPAMSLRLVTVELDKDRQTIHSSSEVCWAMTVDLVLDMNLPPEQSVTEPDPTGWNNLMVAANAFARLYLSEDSTIRTIVDDVIYGDVDPDDDSKPDTGRLAQSVIVLYRTLWNDPNHLLTSEENGI